MQANGQTYFDLEENVPEADRQRLADADKARIEAEVREHREAIHLLLREREAAERG